MSRRYAPGFWQKIMEHYTNDELAHLLTLMADTHRGPTPFNAKWWRDYAARNPTIERDEISVAACLEGADEHECRFVKGEHLDWGLNPDHANEFWDGFEWGSKT